MSEEKQPEFVVQDRRRWTTEGERREDAPEPEVKPAAQVGTPPPKPQGGPPPPPKQQQAPQQQPPPPRPASPLDPGGAAASSYAASGIGYEKINFERLIISLAQTAMLQLGLLAHDPSQPLEPDMMGARETIDILGILQEKTRGNLSQKEERLVENTLYELRMAWVQIDRKLATAKQPPR